MCGTKVFQGRFQKATLQRCEVNSGTAVRVSTSETRLYDALLRLSFDSLRKIESEVLRGVQDVTKHLHTHREQT